MTLEIRRAVVYRAEHVTGPRCVHVGLQFGKTPESGPSIRRTIRDDTRQEKLDLEGYLAEVMSGVSHANQELGACLEVEEVEVWLDDYLGQGQVQYVAYKIALEAIEQARA